MIFYMRVASGPSFPVARFPFPRPTDLSAQTIAAATVRYEMARPTPAAMAAVAGSSRWMLGSNPTLRLSIMAQKQMRFRHWAANTLEESRISPNSVFTTFCNSWSYVCAGDSWLVLLCHEVFKLQVTYRLEGEGNGGDNARRVCRPSCDSWRSSCTLVVFLVLR